jgi:hypothetical protein
MSAELDPDICPLCLQPNGCEHHCGGPDENTCWCHKLIVPASIFQLVPPGALHRSCVCRSCLIKHGAKPIPVK